MPVYDRYIESLDKFKALPNTEKGIYIAALQSTYHVSLNEIAFSMRGASDNPKAFVNYLTSCGIRGDRRLGSMSTAIQWAGFLSGAFDIYGYRIDREDSYKARPVPIAPASLELRGSPDVLLRMLNAAASSAMSTGSQYAIRLSIEEVSVA